MSQADGSTGLAMREWIARDTAHAARRHIFRWICLVLPLLLCAATARAQGTITWATLHFPPWMILDGASRGMGVWDSLQKELIARLPEYEHRVARMKNLRYEQLARQGEHVCKVYYFKTPEREELLHYSIPSVVFLANHVVMRGDKARELGNPASISLARLVDDANFRGTFIAGRSYGMEVDRILLGIESRRHLDSRVVDNQNLFEYLGLGRTDYILEFPAVRSFFEQDLGIRPDVVNIAIDGAVPYNTTYVTCVKNEWGRRVIARVDEILKQLIPTEAHREATLRWYRPAEQRELAKYYRQVLLDPLRADRQAQ